MVVDREHLITNDGGTEIIGPYSHISHEVPSEDIRVVEPAYNNYIHVLSINGCVLGFLTAFAGVLQVFAFPMLCPNGSGYISFSGDYFYGFTIWSGVALVICSSSGVRTTLTKRRSTVHRYCVTQLLTCVISWLALAFMVTAFASGTLNGLDECQRTGHIVSATFISLSVCIHLITFTFNCLTTFRTKPMELFRYCLESCNEHCCQQPDDMRVQDDI